MEAYEGVVQIKEENMPESKLESLFLIPQNERHKTGTFKHDESLPSLPLPDLKHTLQRYLDSVKPLVSDEEFQNTVRIVELFEKGVGRKLNEKLKKKSKTERNWVEKWWENLAYLSTRAPLIPYCSMDGVQPAEIVNWSYGSQDDQIKHAALYGHFLVKFWKLLREEGIKPTQSGEKMFSMSQFRRLYNTVRVPGEEMDELISYFKTAKEGSCPSTVIVMCRGRLFSIDGVDGSGEPLTPPEWEECLWQISNACEKDYNNKLKRKGVAVLTCDTRTSWSQNRKRLQSVSNKNKQLLKDVETCAFILALDDDTPDTESEVSTCNLCGDYNNRWADKSMTMIYYKNGRSGGICDHTAFDGIASVTCQYFGLTALQEAKGVWQGAKPQRNLPKILEIEFDLDSHLKSEIERVDRVSSDHKREIRMTRHAFNDYGKMEIQKFQLHPDSYVQMALQLAYYRFHGKPAPCYETATTRSYYNGRTETLRPCTTECLAWVSSMLDKKYTNQERKILLEKAIKRHDDLMSEARENAGCDRHLFGLYCTALEEGLEIPDIYSDISFSKSGGGGNFILSTSCVGYTPVGGGMAPMCKDGYGIFYNIMPNKIHCTISVNTQSNETDAFKYSESLRTSLRQMRQVLLDAARSTSKL